GASRQERVMTGEWSGPGMPTLDLGVVGNCCVAALIDRSAALTWMCYPRLDGDPIFCKLIGGDLLAQSDPAAGAFVVGVEGGRPVRQSYIENTPVLVTEIESDAGTIRVTDFCPRFVEYGRMFRPAMLIRIIEPVRGQPRVRLSIRPRADHGRRAAEWRRGSHHLRYLLTDDALRITTDAAIDMVASATPFVLSRRVVFIMGPDEPLGRPPAEVARELRERTIAYWREWTRSLSIPFEWQDVVIRAAITLKLCAYDETGGIVAALTTSIPEFGQGARNWDYRFCWLRDAFFTVQALNRLGATRTLEDYMGYIGNIAAGSPDGRLQPLYGLSFQTGIVEWEEAALGGYRNLGPVRFGNAAYTQAQHDAYGSVIMAMAQAFFDRRMLVRGSEQLFRQLETLGRQAQARWDKPDAGIWEFRTRASVHTHSAVMCWAACDRLARIAGSLFLTEEAAGWRNSADGMRDEILKRAWNKKLASFVSTFGGDDIDASLLMLADVDFVGLDDPRFLSTVRRVEEVLRTGSHVKRYATADDFGEPESAFTVCTLWYVECLARIGREEEARELFEDVLRTRNHLGLLSEGFHVGTGELWGNFPQTYSMVGLIRCASRLSMSWERAF
ncbi:MAG: glycoside hydrolase family 15 protein, partial [Beijerinckiaceae bacterium]